MGVDYKNLEIKEFNYATYLKINELLSLQKERSDPPHHDEMFFIIIHQAAELWFKEILHETAILVESLQKGVVSRALKTLKRITAIMDLQVSQINLLSTLTPVEFAGFRGNLNNASGLQSFQFRKIETVFGLRDEFFLKFFQKDPVKIKELQALMAAPSVYDEFLIALKKAGFAIGSDVLQRDFSKTRAMNNDLAAVLHEIYENPKENYHWVLLFESMIDLDERFALWKSVHIIMVARTIGHAHGTGGSAGSEFLRSRMDLRFFPELWQVRNLIGDKVSAAFSKEQTKGSSKAP